MSGRQAAPAATTRAAAPSEGSGYCACHTEGSKRHQRRQRAPQPLLEALGTAPATRRAASGTSGDNTRHSPFWRLRRVRGQPAGSQRHQRRQRAPQPLPEPVESAPAIARAASGTSGDNAAAPATTTRAVAPSGGSGYCACHAEPAAPAATTRAAAPSGASGECASHAEGSQRQPATARTASGTSGDNARRSPFWRLWRVLWVLRLARARQHTPKRRGVCEDAHAWRSCWCWCGW